MQRELDTLPTERRRLCSLLLNLLASVTVSTNRVWWKWCCFYNLATSKLDHKKAMNFLLPLPWDTHSWNPTTMLGGSPNLPMQRDYK